MSDIQVVAVSMMLMCGALAYGLTTLAKRVEALEKRDHWRVDCKPVDPGKEPTKQ